ncbi:hypothetical protein M2122_000816 [Polynucleobacter sphagniphilus]|nr:hypothetical protein [Polynucleobacter sphagniphilus]
MRVAQVASQKTLLGLLLLEISKEKLLRYIASQNYSFVTTSSLLATATLFSLVTLHLETSNSQKYLAIDKKNHYF